MQFGASSFIWASPFSNSTLHLIDHVKSLGFDFLEIAVENPATIDTAAISERASEAGVEIIVCGAFGPDRDISSEDEALRKNGVSYIRQCIDFAKALKSPTVIGPMYSATGKTRLLSREEREAQWQLGTENLKPLAAYAAEQDIKLAVEPLNRFETDFVNTVEQGLEFCQRVGLDNVGLLLDSFHMNIEEKDIPAALKNASGKIFHFHACANDRGTPGEDHLPWEEIADALRQSGYSGPIGIESFTPEIKEIARAVSIWRPLAKSQDDLARNGLKFLTQVFNA